MLGVVECGEDRHEGESISRQREQKVQKQGVGIVLGRVPNQQVSEGRVGGG